MSLALASEAGYGLAMTADEVRAWPIELKLRLMEAIWEDFRQRFEQAGLSQEQKDLLEQRRARVRAGTARLVDWDEVKATIGKS